MNSIVAFIVGLIFAAGLGLSGMTQPHIVRGFLDLFGSWNPTLIGVMAGAIAVHSLAFFLLIKKKAKPIYAEVFQIPTRKDIDLRLLGGAALFGLGWGWAGICPGPGIVASAGLAPGVLIFLAAMLVGMGIFKALKL